MRDQQQLASYMGKSILLRRGMVSWWFRSTKNGSKSHRGTVGYVILPNQQDTPPIWQTLLEKSHTKG
ncbi:hypothetical protein BB560_004349 [Smittium megazygosporum]|uniref:Uncharacterized protein n=1 Tax=Smittium megazygosporum TaxID=133381 RepID=A0A2T9Z9K6_9FUNG|nr:hypothetical protein BB560_004349 [Smittium megazygosporum]